MKTMTIRLNTIDDANNFVKVIDKYEYDIDAVYGRYVIDAKSIMGLLSLGIPKKINIVIHSNNSNIIKQITSDISEWIVEGE